MRTLVVGMMWGALSLALSGNAHALSGVVTRVSDGDTVWVKPARGKPVKVRLQGIDAPESCQAWGTQAHDALAGRVMNQQVTVRVVAKDIYHRSVGKLLLQGSDMGAWMVRSGNAWSYRFHKSWGPYAAEEREARAGKRGLFKARAAVEPRTFRKAHGPCSYSAKARLSERPD